MAQYDFYLKDVLLPVAPEQLKITVNNNNSTYILIDEGQINLLKKAKLSDIEFDCLIPQTEYPFTVYPDGFKKASFFLDHFEKLKTSQEPFQFIVSRRLAGGNNLFNTNMKVSMESYTVTESAKNAPDLTVKIKLKQYRDYGTKVCQEKEPSPEAKTTPVEVKEERPPSTTGNNPNSGLPTTYTVKNGDCLWNIAKKYYGDGTQYLKIRNANQGVVGRRGGNPDMIWTGDVLTIPA